MTTTTESGDSYERMNLNIRRIKQDASIQINKINDEYYLRIIQLRATLNKYMIGGSGGYITSEDININNTLSETSEELNIVDKYLE